MVVCLYAFKEEDGLVIEVRAGFSCTRQGGRVQARDNIPTRSYIPRPPQVHTYMRVLHVSWVCLVPLAHTHAQIRMARQHSQETERQVLSGYR